MIPLGLATKLGGALAVLIGFKFFVASIEQRGMDKCQRAHEAASAENYRENADELSRIAAKSRTQALENAAAGGRLSAAAERLRGAVAGSGLVIRPASAAGSAPASETELVSAELLRRAEELARFADESHRAGSSCEASADAVNK